MKQVFTTIFILSSLLSFAQPGLDWVGTAAAGGVGNDIVEDVFVDAAGNTFACGSFTGALTLGATAHNAGTTTQLFVVKYNSLGVVQWSTVSSGDSKAFAHAISVDDDGFVYVGGYHTSTTTTVGSLVIPSIANEEILVLKLTPSGQALHLIRPDIITSGKSQVLDLEADGADVFFTGFYKGGNLVLGGNAVLAPAQDEVFVCRMDSDLTASTWVVPLVGSKKEYGNGIMVDGNNIYVTGVYQTDLAIDATGPIDYDLPDYGSDGLFLVNLSKANGVGNWATSAGSFKDDSWGNDLAVEGGNIYLTGRCADSTLFVSTPVKSAPFTYNDTIFSNGGSEILIAKYDGSGNLLWVKNEGGIGNDEGHGITVDSTCSEVEICGVFESNVNFGGSELLIANGEDMFVSSYDYNGVFNWAFQENSGGNENATSISANNGRTSVGGFYDVVTTFSLTPPAPIANNGGDDHFVSSFQCANANPCGPTILCRQNDTVTATAGCTWTLGNYVGQDTIVDGCALGYTETQSPIAGTILPPGTHAITMTVTDVNSTSKVCAFLLIVKAPNVNPTTINCGDWLPNETTVGFGDNENSFGCVVFPTNGEDKFYQINVPAGNYWLQMTIDSVADANDPWLETFWLGGACPTGGCISSDWYDIATQKFNGSGNNTQQFLAIGPGTYYFVVDARNDGIDSFNISFQCLESGIEFDETVSCGDPNNDGIIPYVNASPVLTTQNCQAVNICHDLFIANHNGFEWVDSVFMELESCYQNVVPTNTAGFYQPGNWVGTYIPVSNGIAWQFNNSSNPVWGDGSSGYFSCDSAKTRLHTLCFTADISATCAADSNLNVGISIYDDGVGSNSNTVAGFDFVLSDDFTIVDPPPTISCPANVSVNNAIGNCSAQVVGIGPTASGDNCPNPFITYTLSGVTTGSGANDASGNIFNLGITTVQYLITDSAGAKDSCQFTVTVVDAEIPTITCPGNIVVNSSISSCDTVLNGIAPLFIGDNCAIDSVGYKIAGATNVSNGLNDASGTTFNVGISLVVYTITDSAGNVDTCSFTVTVNDIVNPTITCPGNVSIPCPAIVNGINPTGIGDNCAIDSVSYVLTGVTTGSGLNDASGTFFNNGVTTVTYTATDSAGNTTSCNFTVTVNDIVNPTITCPGNVSIPCPAIVNGINPTGIGDNCAIDSVSYVLTGVTTGSGLNDASGTTFNNGVTTVTYTATDSSGNTTSCNFTVTVNDIVNPTITCPGNVSIPCPAIVNGINPTGIGDNCAIDSVSYVLTGVTTGSGLNDASGTFFNNGVTTVTYTATDSAGNTTSCNFTVTVNDIVNPTITCPGNVSIPCPAIVNGINPTGIGDNCAIDSVSYVLTGVTTGSGLNDASGTFFNNGVTTVAYTATDSAGNTTSCNFTVTVNDIVNPTITCPGNVSIPCPAIVNGINPTGIGDNCAIDSVSYVLTGVTTGSGLNDASGTTFNQGVTTVTYTATDSAGNTTSCNFTVTVNDIVNPTITCPGNVSIPCPAIVNGINPTGIGDNCAIDSVSYVLTGVTTGSGLNDASGTTFNNGVTTVTYTATDSSGNTTSCNFTVTVNDIVNPTITCPGNVSIPCPAIVNGINPTGIGDNCAIDSVSYVLTGVTTGSGLNDASGTTFNNGVTTVTYTATDSSGNTTSCNFTVTVNDIVNPTITCPGNVSIPCPAIVNGINPTGIGDNCAIDSVSYVLTGVTTGSGLNDASGTTFNNGVTTVTYTATDSSGNTTSCNFTVTVNDIVNPTITCPGNVTIPCPATVSSIAPLTTADNCTIDSVAYVLIGATIGAGSADASGTFFNAGITTVLYYIYDISGNLDSCSFTVTVSDLINPTITCPANVVASTSTTGCDTIVNGLIPLAFGDNCAVDSVSYVLTGATTGSGLNDASGTTFNLGVTTVTYTVTDSSGNTTSCNFTVTVNDDVNPTITCPSNVNISCPAIVSGITPVAFGDNCAVDSVSYVLTGATSGSGLNDASGLFYNDGITTVTYIIYDLSGNVDSCNFIVTVNDTVNPTISCPNNIVVCDSNVVVPLSITNDNCGVQSVSNDYNLTSDASGIYPPGITTVNWTITDSSGNSANCAMTVEVQIPPTANAGPDQILIGRNSTNFAANTPLQGVGSWYSVTGFGNISSLIDPLSFVEDLEKGENIFEWTVSYGVCLDSTDEVVIMVIPLTIPNGFSPNGDGDNDLFVVDGLELLENEVAIFNRWGVELFSVANYQNDWDGRSKSGNDLPEDTYFYIIKIPGLNEEVSGFVVLKR